MSGRVRLADGRDVSFTAVKDNIAPEFSLSVPSALANRDVTVRATVIADEEGAGCCTAAWSPRPAATTPLSATYRFTSPGQHQLEVTVTDRYGASTRRTATLNVLNGPPTALIAEPTGDTTVIVGRPLHFQGLGTDPNAGPGPGPGEVPCAALSWRLSVSTDSAFPRPGCSGDVVFDTPGVRTLTLRVTDPDDASVFTEARVLVTVLAAPANRPPEIRLDLSAPSLSGAAYDANLSLTAEAAGSDPEGDTPLSYRWTATVLHASGEVALAEREIGSSARVSWRPVTMSGLGSLPECNSFAGAKLRLRVEVTDRLGNTARLSRDVQVVCVPQ